MFNLSKGLDVPNFNFALINYFGVLNLERVRTGPTLIGYSIDCMGVNIFLDARMLSDMELKCVLGRYFTV